MFVREVQDDEGVVFATPLLLGSVAFKARSASLYVCCDAFLRVGAVEERRLQLALKREVILERHLRS